MILSRLLLNVSIKRAPGGFAVYKGPLLIGTCQFFNDAYFLARGEC